MVDLVEKLKKTIALLADKNLKKRDRVKRTSRLFSECVRYFIVDVGVNPVCGPRCSACCYRMPFIRSGMEEEYIQLVLDGIPLNTQKVVVPKIPDILKSWRDLCAEHGQNYRRIVHLLDIQMDWVKANRPCPLLSDGLCVIHPRIPLDCKLTMKASSICLDPADCDFAAGMHESVIKSCHEIDRALKKRPYHDTPLIEVLHLWATK